VVADVALEASGACGLPLLPVCLHTRTTDAFRT
jgi:hypothetical protein